MTNSLRHGPVRERPGSASDEELDHGRAEDGDAAQQGEQDEFARAHGPDIVVLPGHGSGRDMQGCRAWTLSSVAPAGSSAPCCSARSPRTGTGSSRWSAGRPDRPTRSSGTPPQARSTPPPSKASTPWCTWPARASPTSAGPRTAAARSSRAARRAPALLAGALAKLDRPPSAFVSGSAVGFYGDGGEQVLTESSPRGDVFLSELCEAWEAAAAPAADAGIRTARIRTGLVITPDGGPLAKLLPLFKLGSGGRMGGGREWWSWISLTDEIRAIRFLLDHDVSGPVNLTAPEPGPQRRADEGARPRAAPPGAAAGALVRTEAGPRHRPGRTSCCSSASASRPRC